MGIHDDVGKYGLESKLSWFPMVVSFFLFAPALGHDPIWVFPKMGGKPPKWMVKIMENPIKMDDLGGKNPIFGNIQFD